MFSAALLGRMFEIERRGGHVHVYKYAHVYSEIQTWFYNIHFLVFPFFGQSIEIGVVHCKLVALSYQAYRESFVGTVL